MTPSLLPRPWVLQAVISGIVTATGYGLGLVVAWLVRRLVGRERSLPHAGRTAWWSLAVLSGVLIVVFLYLGSAWQRDIYRLMGLRPPVRYGYVSVLILAGAIFLALVGFARLLPRAARRVARVLGRWIPAAVARLAGVVAVAAVVIFVLNGLIVHRLLAAADSSFKTINGETSPGVAAPDNPRDQAAPTRW